MEGYGIERGQLTRKQTSVAAPHISTALSPLNFTDPLRFVPERWLGDPRYKNDKLAASQPFSLGARSCVGKVSTCLFPFWLPLFQNLGDEEVQRRVS